jgi:hypothetical protein
LNQVFRIGLASADASQPALEIGAQVGTQARQKRAVRASIAIEPG